jgi:hypothetical protein
MAGWITLFERITNTPLNRSLVQAACAFAVLPALVSFAGFAVYPFGDADFHYFHTRTMIEWGGIAPVLLGVGMIWQLLLPSPGALKSAPTSPKGEVSPRDALYSNIEAGSVTSPLGEVEIPPLSPPVTGGIRGGFRVRANQCRAYISTLTMSVVLFIAGGALGLMISGQNVTIPAHYHGAIVAVTLALMGLAYAMLPRFGYQSVAQSRLAFWQPIIYGIGQLMHVSGLAYSGGYGVLRKTAGGFANMSPEVKASLGVMGLGGLLAIIGGLLFVVVMLRVRRVGN